MEQLSQSIFGAVECIKDLFQKTKDGEVDSKQKMILYGKCSSGWRAKVAKFCVRVYK